LIDKFIHGTSCGEDPSSLLPLHKPLRERNERILQEKAFFFSPKISK
jgi:hypothetical protein